MPGEHAGLPHFSERQPQQARVAAQGRERETIEGTQPRPLLGGYRAKRGERLVKLLRNRIDGRVGDGIEHSQAAQGGRDERLHPRHAHVSEDPLRDEREARGHR